MARISLDVSFIENVDVNGLSHAALRLHLMALSYAKRFDIVVLPAHVVPWLRKRIGVRKGAVDELVTRGLWFLDDETDGYLLSDHHRPYSQYRPAIPLRVRWEVLARDENRCVICGATERLSLDHVIPFSKGGPDTVENLRVLCRYCNSRRGAGRFTDEELRGLA